VAAKNKQITDNHYTSISEVAGRQSSISVFGKLLKNGEIKSDASGLTHPSGADENLQLAQVVGYMEQGQCVRLTEPQLIALPAPDGPADGCGWDPKEYVVWKSLPKNWVTLHLQASTKSLQDSLKPFASAAAATHCLERPDAIILVRSCSKAPDNLSLKTPLGQLFPTAGGRNTFCKCVADGVPTELPKIPCGATNTLQDVIDAISC
jgi:hypothetical protein